MTTNGPKVSNGIVSNNPDFFTRADPDVNNKYRQVVRLDVGVGTAESLVNSATVGLPGNITQVGGVAVTLGQKAEAASIPVVLATEQDTAKNSSDTTEGQFTGIGVLKAAPFEGSPQWAAWPASDTGIPFAGIYASDAAAVGSFASLLYRDSSGASNDRGLLTRSILTGIDSSSIGNTRTAFVANATPGVSDNGVVTRNIPSGTQNVSLVSATALSASAPASISTGSGAAATLLAANSNRRKFIINNFSSAFLFVKFGSGASSTDYSLFILPNTFYESFIGDYAGIVTARTNSGTVNILVQEFT
jgi:hypothetical protein